MNEPKKTPQLENGYTKIANGIIEALCETSLSSYEAQILWFIFRKTYGWNKKEDHIANSQFVEATGIHKAHVSRSIKLLISRSIVTKGGNKISLQKDTSLWVKKLPKGVNTHHVEKLPKGVTVVTKGGNTVADGGNKKLPKGADTKESKETIQKTLLQKKVAPFSKIDDLSENDLQEIATRYKVPMAFVLSKREDMYLWANEKAGRGKGRNWKLTLMNWVKRDALKVVQKHHDRQTTVNKYKLTEV